MAIEIVDFTITNGWIFHSYVNISQRVDTHPPKNAIKYPLDIPYIIYYQDITYTIRFYHIYTYILPHITVRYDPYSLSKKSQGLSRRNGFTKNPRIPPGSLRYTQMERAPLTLENAGMAVPWKEENLRQIFWEFHSEKDEKTSMEVAEKWWFNMIQLWNMMNLLWKNDDLTMKNDELSWKMTIELWTIPYASCMYQHLH